MENKPVLYECDRTACKDCGPDCHLTMNPEHAKNFTMEWAGTYVEKKKEKTFTNKMVTAAMELLVVVGIISLGFKLMTWAML